MILGHGCGGTDEPSQGYDVTGTWVGSYWAGRTIGYTLKFGQNGRQLWATGTDDRGNSRGWNGYIETTGYISLISGRHMFRLTVTGDTMAGSYHDVNYAFQHAMFERAK